MQISYDAKTKVFHLSNAHFSYVMQLQRGWLCHLYWGAPLRQYRGSNPLQLHNRDFSPNPAYARTSAARCFSLDTLPLEYPAFGHGDFRPTSLRVQGPDGCDVTDLQYVSHSISSGKPALQGLPATWAAKAADAATLTVLLEDAHTGLQAALGYTLFADSPALCRSVCLTNTGKAPLRLLQADSACVDFRNQRQLDLLTLSGGHCHEFNLSRAPLRPGTQCVESLRGASSHQFAPFLALARPDAGEDFGEVYAMNLVYSGSFAASAQLDQTNSVRASLGLNPRNFSWVLAPGQSFQTPEAVLVYTAQGLGGMSRAFHQLYRQHLLRGKFRQAERPILINNWEATYFDFNEAKLLKIAKCAKGLGIELFVLDDGWFGHRNDDTSSLGDWVADKRKLPAGIRSLSQKIVDLGLRFGLWFEPEMISADSDLYRAHPDWVLCAPGWEPSYSRNQMVLDLSRDDVCDHLVQAVCRVLEDKNISYVKWDMNRHITEVGSALLPADRQGEVWHRYMLGLYRVMEEITARNPDVLFEGCSGGGGRYDAGMLYYMPQYWTSDNTDAVSRLQIQYGASTLFPPLTMGSHVSAVPNHQLGRVTSLATRGAAAMSGNLGYELDVCKLSLSEQAEVRRQVAFYKQIRPIVQFGDFYRLLSPFASNEAAWNFVTPEKDAAVAMYFRVLAESLLQVRFLRLKGLDPQALYRDNESGAVYGGDELMHVGLTIPADRGDFTSHLWLFRKVE